MHNRHESPHSADGRGLDFASCPLVVATILRGDGITGVDTHVRQVRRYLEESATGSSLVTSFSWAQPLTYPVYGVRQLLLDRVNRPASVAWYLYWHEVFLARALRRHLDHAADCVVYAQEPIAARAALRARRGPHQRVVMAVHFRTSLADEWADKKEIKRDGSVFRAIRRLERETIPRVDGLVYVSRWAREALLSWLPDAAGVPFAVINNFVQSVSAEPFQEPLADLVTVGNLDIVKNHRFLLDVLAEAKRAGKSLTLDIFGEGPCRRDLVQQAQSLGLEQQVQLRGFRRDVRDFLPRYRAYVHASYSESSSLAIMEAMAAGLPIVAGNIGPISELYDDGVEGQFWPLDDPAKAAAVLLDFLESEPTRLKAAHAAHLRFRRDYDAEIVGPQLQSFLLGLTPALPRSEVTSSVPG
jgi:glycosyltransferase involved in cell wall biosynthesis